MVQKVLQQAKRLLREDPFDAGHDYEHHLAVATNCLTIIEDEQLDVDVNALLIAAWWHDYKRDQDEENNRVLTRAMTTAGFKQKYIDKVLSIKNSHSYGRDQESLEAQILFDADKLEYASVPRMERVSEAVESGKMTKEVLGKYKIAFKDRIAKVLESFHFESTRREMKSRIKRVREYTETHPLWSGLVDEL